MPQPRTKSARIKFAVRLIEVAVDAIYEASVAEFDPDDLARVNKIGERLCDVSRNADRLRRRVLQLAA